nr:LOW QUALITY PROTEIN: E3 ubiquitin-protein ligase HERC2 [Macaca fascicularis]
MSKLSGKAAAFLCLLWTKKAFHGIDFMWCLHPPLLAACMFRVSSAVPGLGAKVWTVSPEWDPERRCLSPSPSCAGPGDQGCSRNARHQRTRSVPLQDQHLALAILLELAVQRGTLSQMLSAILLLLQLWDSGAQETDNERSAQDTNAPLLPLLQRFQSIICRKDTPHSEGDMHLLSGPLSPNESFLRYLTLPKTASLPLTCDRPWLSSWAI